MCESGLRHQELFQDHPTKSIKPFKIKMSSDLCIRYCPSPSVEIRGALGA